MLSNGIISLDDSYTMNGNGATQLIKNKKLDGSQLPHDVPLEPRAPLTVDRFSSRKPAGLSNRPLRDKDA